jgi:hypothetical protein
MIYLRYFASVLIWQFLNPFGIWQSILQNGGQIIAILRSRVSKTVTPSIPMSLPFEGFWTVINGGLDIQSSHSWNLITQRYAYDLIITNKDGKKYDADASKAENYYAFGQNVLAPADGMVIKVQNNIRDYAYAGTGSIDLRTRDMRGNYVIIRHADHVYSVTAHLRKNSCIVKPGDLVKRGQVIAKCGNSGHSTEPHIHFHLQDHSNFYLAIGLPILFKNIEIADNASMASKKVEYGYISKNCRVRNITIDKEVSNEPGNGISRAKGGLLSLLSSALNILGLAVWLFFIYIWFIRPVSKVIIG